MPTWLRIVPIEGNEGEHKTQQWVAIYSDIIKQIFPIQASDNVLVERKRAISLFATIVLWYHATSIHFTVYQALVC